MKVLMLDAPQAMLDERRRLGQDGRDEMWDGVLHTEHDYRVPDQLYCREEHLSERGAEGAELVVEIRSPRDETYEKLDFYSALGVPEVLVVHPEDRSVEMFRAVGGRLLPVQTSREGGLSSETLGVEFRTAGGKLALAWAEGSAEI